MASRHQELAPSCYIVLEDKYYKPKGYWNNMGDIWPEGHDPWGKKDGKVLPRISDIFVDQI